MSQPQPKTCEKKIKLAESKVQKIMSKIQVLKLNNSYTSRLGDSKPRKNIICVNKSKLNVVYALGGVLLFLGARWIYKEWPSSQVKVTLFYPGIVTCTCRTYQHTARSGPKEDK